MKKRLLSMVLTVIMLGEPDPHVGLCGQEVR